MRHSIDSTRVKISYTSFTPRHRVAGMLAESSVRGWGIALAAILTFGSVVTLLNHRQYAYAAGVSLMMVALVPATLAIPRANQVKLSVQVE
jgi:hypothetical protein